MCVKKYKGCLLKSGTLQVTTDEELITHLTFPISIWMTAIVWQDCVATLQKCARLSQLTLMLFGGRKLVKEDTNLDQCLR